MLQEKLSLVDIFIYTLILNQTDCTHKQLPFINNIHIKIFESMCVKLFHKK